MNVTKTEPKHKMFGVDYTVTKSTDCLPPQGVITLTFNTLENSRESVAEDGIAISAGAIVESDRKKKNALEICNGLKEIFTGQEPKIWPGLNAEGNIDNTHIGTVSLTLLVGDRATDFALFDKKMQGLMQHIAHGGMPFGEMDEIRKTTPVLTTFGQKARRGSETKNFDPLVLRQNFSNEVKGALGTTVDERTQEILIDRLTVSTLRMLKSPKHSHTPAGIA